MFDMGRSSRAQLFAIIITLAFVLVLIILSFKMNSGLLESQRIIHDNADPCIRNNEIDLTHTSTGSTHGYWKKFQQGSRIDFHLYSAFYDDRPSGGSSPFVRILAVKTASTQRRGVTCQVHFNTTNMSHEVPAKLVKLDQWETFTFNGKNYENWRIDCEIEASHTALPSHVALKACNVSSTLIPVAVPEKVHQRKEFGICLGLSYGEGTSIENWVEWFEFYKILGVSEFNIYNCSLPAKYDNVFDYYIAQGTLRMFQMPAPVRMSKFRSGCFIPVQTSFNDCLMRNMYRYRYQIYVDADEFLIPQNKDTSTLQELIDETSRVMSHKLKDKEAVLYMFQNQYHFMHMQPDSSKPKYLRTMSYRSHLYPGGPPKYFVNPQYCLNSYNHGCPHYLQLPPAMTASIDVPPEVAVLQHYRSCVGATTSCNSFFRRTYNDNNILRFETQLNTNVLDVFNKIGIKVN